MGGGGVGEDEEALPWRKVNNSQAPLPHLTSPHPPGAAGPYKEVEEILLSVQTWPFFCGGPFPRQRQAEM